MSEMIACLRVSTDRRGRSGLGLDSQRQAISRFAQSERLELVGEHVEVEMGKGVDALDCGHSCAQRSKRRVSAPSWSPSSIGSAETWRSWQA
jgi:hypothetical protein